MGHRIIGTTIALALCTAGCATTTPATKQSPGPETAPAPSGPTVTSEQNDAIDAVFRRKAGELQSCWQEEYERSKNRKLEGDVAVQMVVTTSGHPTHVTIPSSTLGVPAIDTCIIEAISKWVFPEGPADAPYRRTVHLGAQF